MFQIPITQSRRNSKKNSINCKNQKSVKSILKIEDIEVEFVFSKKASLIRISVNNQSKVRLVVPRYARIEDAREFFLAKIGWVRKTLQKIANKNDPKNNFNDYPKLSAEEFLMRNRFLILRCRKLADKYGFKVNQINLRRQKSIWGSCSAKNNISLNSSLVFVNDELIDYVIFHELVHTKIKNHGVKFWSALEKLMPNARILDRELKKHKPGIMLR